MITVLLRHNSTRMVNVGRRMDWTTRTITGQYAQLLQLDWLDIKVTT